MNIAEKRQLLYGWISDIDNEEALDRLISQYIETSDDQFIRIDTEKIMRQWDYWRNRIAEGDKSSAPSDWFGGVIDTFMEQCPPEFQQVINDDFWDII